jgi:hypothetical protein
VLYIVSCTQSLSLVKCFIQILFIFLESSTPAPVIVRLGGDENGIIGVVDLSQFTLERAREIASIFTDPAINIPCAIANNNAGQETITIGIKLLD